MSMSQIVVVKTASGNGTITIVAAVITFIAIILAAIIQAFFGYKTVLVQRPGIAASSWQVQARENGWVPKDECKWHSVPAVGKDESGKSIWIEINILSEEYRWIFASASEIELSGSVEDLGKLIRSLDTSNSQAIVCVGAASVEGDRKEQEILARDRADKLLAVVRTEMNPGFPMFGINLGRYRGPDSKPRDPKETATQRRVIILEILKEEKDVDRRAAIFDALVKARQASSPIPFDVRNYFSFDLYRAKF